jgi:hypothetical protein
VEALTHPQAGDQSHRLEPVSPPPEHPGREHIIGNRLRWAARVVRYLLYRHRTGQRPLF